MKTLSKRISLFLIIACDALKNLSDRKNEEFCNLGGKPTPSKTEFIEIMKDALKTVKTKGK